MDLRLFSGMKLRTKFDTILSRLENRIVQALVIPKKRIKTKPTKASKERKLKLKKIRSEIKKNRGKII